VNDPSVTEGGDLVYTVTLSRAAATPITVSYATADGTAQAADYTAHSGTLTFAAGELSKTVTVVTTGDTADEPNETVLLNLSNASGATIADAQGVGTIIDNDDPVTPPPEPPPTNTPPTITILDSSVQEGGNLNFRVYLDKPATERVSFNYATSPDTAASSTDYSAQSGGMFIPVGQQHATISVPTRVDTLDEVDETMFMTLSNVVGATINDGVATGTIRDDDPASPPPAPPSGQPSIFVRDASVTEGGQLVFTVSTNGAPAIAPISYRITSADGTARGESIGPEPNQIDYMPYDLYGTFQPGESNQQHFVTTIADGRTEPTENMFMLLSEVSGAVVFDSLGEGTIIA
jgi:chitinase